MQFFTQVLLLASTAAAVNIQLYTGSGQCSGNFVSCNNVNQNVCCGVQSGQAKGAVYYTGLPNPATVRTYGRSEYCNNQIRSDRTTSPNWCVYNLAGQITGGHWAFASKKRSMREREEEVECVRPDTGFVQGRQFNLTSLDDKAFDEFMDYVQSVEPEVPKQFLAAEIVNSDGDAVAM